MMDVAGRSSPSHLRRNDRRAAPRRGVPGPGNMIINGRFLAAKPTGVQRVARALVAELDQRTRHRGAENWSVSRPRGSLAPDTAMIKDEIVGRLGGQAWEQVTLPLHARGRLLLNLCNTAPMHHPRNVVMIHDAQVYLSPQSYSLSFRNWYRFLLPYIGHRAQRVITVSAYSKAQLVKFGVAPEANIFVIPNGADHLSGVSPDEAILDLLELRSQAFVLAISSTQVHKNIAVLFEAFRHRFLRNVTLVMVGSTTARMLLAAGLQPPPGTVFTGAINDAGLSGLLRHATAFAAPSLTEGFGLPPLEAMSLGCPVVAAPEGAMPEACGQAAIYADAHDPAAWASAIAGFVDDDVLSSAMRRQGRERASTFTWRRSGDKLESVLRPLLDAG